MHEWKVSCYNAGSTSIKVRHFIIKTNDTNNNKHVLQNDRLCCTNERKARVLAFNRHRDVLESTRKKIQPPTGFPLCGSCGWLCSDATFDIFEIDDITGSIEPDVVLYRTVHLGNVNHQKVIYASDQIFDEVSHWAVQHNVKTRSLYKTMFYAFPMARHLLISDSAFHATMPLYVKTLPVPLAMREAGACKWGFHGLVYSNIVRQFTSENGIEKPNLICIHLGGGSSAACISKGKSIDTTMSMTPTDGLLMTTRSGSLDPCIPLYFSGLTIDTLNNECGIKALCGTYDFSELLRLCEEGDVQARIAYDSFIYRIVSTIGSYVMILDGNVDAVVFSGGIGYNVDKVREDVTAQCKSLLSKVHSRMSGGVHVCKIFVNEELEMIHTYIQSYVNTEHDDGKV